MVITDLVMAKLDGIEIIRILHNHSPSLPIVAMSGAYGGKFLKVALALGARDTLLKSSSGADLTEAVERRCEPAEGIRICAGTISDGRPHRDRNPVCWTDGPIGLLLQL